MLPGRLIAVIAAATTALVAVGAIAVGFGEGGADAKPRLRVSSLTPFAVVGTGFRAGETVRVTVRIDRGTWSARGRAGSSGRIGVRFPRLKLDACPDYVVAARGDKGSTAGLRSVPRPCGANPAPAP